MRSKVVKTLALALVMCVAGIGLAQQQGKKVRVEEEDTPRPAKQKPPQGKSKLEEMLAAALKNNPDIRVAAANLTLAEAELNRTRLQVTQKVLTLHHAIQSQQATVDFEQKQYERMNGLLQSRAIDSKLVEERFAKLTAAKAKLAELEAQMPALLGKAAHVEGKRPTQDAAMVGLEWLVLQQDSREKMQALWALANAHKATGPMAERLRKALQTPVKVDYKNMPLTDVLTDLMKKIPGLSIRCSPQTDFSISRLYFEESLPVSAVLQALEDDFNFRFLVRDYGILVPDPRSPPPGALTLQEFLRQKPTEK